MERKACSGTPARCHLHTKSHFLVLTTLEDRHYYSHFTDWGIEAQGSVVRQLQGGGKSETWFLIYWLLVQGHLTALKTDPNG